MHILVIDDEIHIQKILKDFLEDCGHNVDCASNGAVALNHLTQTSDIDLIISDICMPKINGEDFLRTVQVRYPGLPTILITGHGTEKTASNAFYDGAYGYLKKPISLNELLNLIDRLERQSVLESEYENAMSHQAMSACDALSENIRKLHQLCAPHFVNNSDFDQLILQIENEILEIQNHVPITP